MKTPETPETPKPVWEYSFYRSILRMDGKAFAIITPDLKNALSAEDATLLVATLNEAESLRAQLEDKFSSLHEACRVAAMMDEINDLKIAHDALAIKLAAAEGRAQGFQESAKQLGDDLIKAQARLDEIDDGGIHSCHPECQRPMCVMRRKLAAAEAELAPYKDRSRGMEGYLDSLIRTKNDAENKVGALQALRELDREALERRFSQLEAETARADALAKQVAVLRDALERLDLRFMSNNENIRAVALAATRPAGEGEKT